MLHDSHSIHIVYRLTKRLKKSLEQFTDQMRKAKKASESWILIFHERTIPKALNYKFCLNLKKKKKIVEFADSAHRIY